jgi:hypothetical protein
MSLDSSHTYLHHHSSHHADLLEDFTHPSTSHLAPDEIYMPPQHQPLNPEDEDDVVPDMHAAFGIQRATQKQREPGWRDLGLVELMNGMSVDAVGNGVRGAPVASAGANAAAGTERVAGSRAATNNAGNGSSADALRVRRRAEGTLGGRLRG